METAFLTYEAGDSLQTLKTKKRGTKWKKNADCLINFRVRFYSWCDGSEKIKSYRRKFSASTSLSAFKKLSWKAKESEQYDKVVIVFAFVEAHLCSATKGQSVLTFMMLLRRNYRLVFEYCKSRLKVTFGGFSLSPFSLAHFYLFTQRTNIKFLSLSISKT